MNTKTKTFIRSIAQVISKRIKIVMIKVRIIIIWYSLKHFTLQTSSKSYLIIIILIFKGKQLMEVRYSMLIVTRTI